MNRIDLAKHFKELGFKIGAEVGVAEGTYSFILCQEIPNLELYCVDMWDTMTGVFHDHRYRQSERVRKLLSPYKATLIKKFSLDAIDDFGDNFFDFVYIDAGHRFDEVMQDIIKWTKKVRKGGIVSGHDYQSPQISLAVDAYTKAHSFITHLTDEPEEYISWFFNKHWNV